MARTSRCGRDSSGSAPGGRRRLDGHAGALRAVSRQSVGDLADQRSDSCSDRLRLARMELATCGAGNLQSVLCQDGAGKIFAALVGSAEGRAMSDRSAIV